MAETAKKSAFMPPLEKVLIPLLEMFCNPIVILKGISASTVDHMPFKEKEGS